MRLLFGFVEVKGEFVSASILEIRDDFKRWLLFSRELDTTSLSIVLDGPLALERVDFSTRRAKAP
jgi:hypothetical protein